MELHSLDNIQKMISDECDQIKTLLLSKNKKYGNSAVEPKRVFSKQSSIEQIKVRIDDKISRIQNIDDEKESSGTVLDLIGYLVLLRVCHKVNGTIGEEDDLWDALKDS